MNRKSSLLAFLLFFAGTHFLLGQTTAVDLVKEWERAKAYTKAYLDAMPDSGYGFKPTPDMRSFAEQMLHLTDGDYLLIPLATNVKSPYSDGELEKSTTDKSKANVTTIVLAGYDFVIASVGKLSQAQINARIKVYDSFDLTREQLLGKAFEHQTHHRGQTTVYLRLQGVKPPHEMLF
ncbi:MAG TPA: DinB family protein [Puia sp.]|jgi:uncharacterized damage-inducible protein DinB